jgi:hypothetical protein
VLVLLVVSVLLLVKVAPEVVEKLCDPEPKKWKDRMGAMTTILAALDCVDIKYACFLVECFNLILSPFEQRCAILPYANRVCFLALSLRMTKTVKDVGKALADNLMDKNAANKPLAAATLGSMFIALDLKDRQELIKGHFMEKIMGACADCKAPMREAAVDCLDRSCTFGEPETAQRPGKDAKVTTRTMLTSK